MLIRQRPVQCRNPPPPLLFPKVYLYRDHRGRLVSCYNDTENPNVERPYERLHFFNVSRSLSATSGASRASARSAAHRIAVPAS